MKLLVMAVVLTASASAQGEAYRLFVNDTAACASFGITGSVCIVPLTTPTPTPTPTPSQDPDCVVTTWNPCTEPAEEEDE